MFVGGRREGRGWGITGLGDICDGNNLVGLLEFVVIGGGNVSDSRKRLPKIALQIGDSIQNYEHILDHVADDTISLPGTSVV